MPVAYPYGYTYQGGQLVWTYVKPVASIEQVRGCMWRIAQQTVLTTPDQYEVASLDRGRLHVSTWRTYDYLQIDYTPVDAVPAEVSEATAQLLAEQLYVPASTAGEIVLIDRFADAEQRYAPPGGPGVAPEGAVGASGLPASVMILLGKWARSRKLVFA